MSQCSLTSTKYLNRKKVSPSCRIPYGQVLLILSSGMDCTSYYGCLGQVIHWGHKLTIHTSVTKNSNLSPKCTNFHVFLNHKTSSVKYVTKSLTEERAQEVTKMTSSSSSYTHLPWLSLRKIACLFQSIIYTAKLFYWKICMKIQSLLKSEISCLPGMAFARECDNWLFTFP